MTDLEDQDTARTSMRSVIAAVDFSSNSELALSWAMTIARAHGASLQIVHAVSRTLPFLNRHEARSPLAEISIGESREGLSRLADQIRSPDQEVECHLLHDRPSVSILKVADWTFSGLIVLGTRGVGGVEQLMLGSTAERVAERASCPVLTVGPQSAKATSLPRRILVATDFSIEADAAAIACQEIFRASEIGAEILLLSVLHTPVGLELDVNVSKMWQEYVGECRALLKERLEVLCRTFGSGTTGAQALLREGIPAAAIVRVAKQENVDLIAIGSRGSFAARRGFLGSVSKRVIQTAPCPVLTVPSLFSKRIRDAVRHA